jgi:hypothetical protein
MPSVEYLELTDFDPFRKIKYIGRDKRFTGRIIYHNLNGEFVNGWVYKNGKVTHTLKKTRPGNDPVISLMSAGRMDCVTVYYCELVHWCTAWYYTEVPEWVYVKCENEYYWEIVDSWEECTWIPGDNEGDEVDDVDGEYDNSGGGEGGYNGVTDCAGITGGHAYIDACGTCVGGTTNRAPCDNISTPEADRFYKSNSTLSNNEKIMLDNALKNMRDSYPAYTMLYNQLIEKGIKFTFKIDPSIPGNAAYSINDGSIRFKSSSYIAKNPLQEELIHAIQHDTYANAMTPSIKNYEFEAKAFQDLACPGFCGYIGSMGMDEEFSQDYKDWIMRIWDNGMNSTDYIEFNQLCNRWTNYEGNFDTSFFPEILEEYFGN